MFVLTQATEEAWVHRAIENIADVLLDHAHCEKKAASTALGLIFRYPERTKLLIPLAQHAGEELVHFELVLKQLERLNIPFERQGPSPYAADLMAACSKEEPDRLLDTLICCSLIEARSCERMKLLAQHLSDPVLAELYEGLLASEARHHALFLSLAEEYFPRDTVRIRLLELADHESRILEGPSELVRMHT